VDWQQVIVYGQLIPVFASSAYTDWKYRKVFNVVSIPALIVMVITRLVIHPQGWLFYAVALAPAFLYYIVAHFTEEVGGGDILIAAYVGLASGIVLTLLAILNAGFLGMIVYYFQTFFGKGKAELRQPWVSFLFLGFCISAVELALLQQMLPIIQPWG
jgi:prepilin signal peptidase PulO-like enzyme (type II secretory pathway)